MTATNTRLNLPSLRNRWRNGKLCHCVCYVARPPSGHQCADLSTQKKEALRFLARLSQEPYGSRVALGVWREDQVSTLKSEHFQVDKETTEDLLDLFNGPMEIMVHSLWDSKAAINRVRSLKRTRGHVGRAPGSMSTSPPPRPPRYLMTYMQ